MLMTLTYGNSMKFHNFGRLGVLPKYKIIISRYTVDVNRLVFFFTF